MRLRPSLIFSRSGEAVSEATPPHASLGPKTKIDLCKICIVGLLIVFGLEEFVMLI